MRHQSTIMIIPPEPPLKKLEDLKLKMCSKYNSKAAELPPHISVMSFGMMTDRGFEKVSENMGKLVKEVPPFHVHSAELEFTGSNDSYPGVYMHFERSPELYNLHELCVAYLQRFEDGKDRSYKKMEKWRPHLTLVGPDVSGEKLDIAKMELEGERYSCSFLVDEIHLTKIVENKLMNCRFELEGKRH